MTKDAIGLYIHFPSASENAYTVIFHPMRARSF